MAVYLIASDIYDISKLRQSKTSDQNDEKYFPIYYRPLVSIVVPAHNEQSTLERNLLSIVNSTYKNIELIIVNDSSTDKTGEIARRFQRRYRDKFRKIKVINVSVRGKARAMNKGLKFARGSLFMCLDADSFLGPDSLACAVQCFSDKRIGALSACVKILPQKGILNLIQRIEYLVSYQMKKAETVTQTQYIVGGIGSMYRMKILRQLNYYATDTITEDIDLSMKLLEHYGKKKYIGFNPKAVVYTESVLSVFDLMSQRFRWKYGRYQAFLKRRKLFWSLDKNHNRLLSWITLPYALFAEFAYTLEPLVVAFIFYLIIQFGDFSMILGSIFTFCFYTIVNVSGSTQNYTKNERIRLAAFAPLAFIFMYILSFVEYTATIRGLLSARKLLRWFKSGEGSCEWTHVARSTIAE